MRTSQSTGGKRLGPAKARNAGVDEAHGELVLFVDSDVILYDDVPNRVREQLSGDGNWVACTATVNTSFGNPNISQGPLP